MNNSSENILDCIVVGAGALGMVLAHTLDESAWGSFGRLRVSVFSRSFLPKKVSVILENGNASQKSIDFLSGTVAEVLSARRPKIVFFCVPPEKTESVCKDWIDAFESSYKKGPSPVLFVFCNNGCLSSGTLRRLRGTIEQFHFVRALFYVGAMKEKSGSLQVVRWTGGVKVLWSLIRPEADTFQTLSAHKMNPLLPIPPRIGLIEWSLVKDICAAEREKFFVNFILASGIGPRLLKNTCLSKALDESKISNLALQFEVLWKSFGVDAEKMKSSLQQTISATGQNINSLSYAGANGDYSTMVWFIQCVEKEIEESSRNVDLNYLSKYLEKVRLDWRVER